MPAPFPHRAKPSVHRTRRARLARRKRSVTMSLLTLGLAVVLSLRPGVSRAQTDDLPPAPIVNDEGGPVSVHGEVSYTNALFTLGTAAPMVILEDQGGFVARDEGFILPVASQTLGQITSDFYTSPFSYTISLPITPQGTRNDLDNDGKDDPGVMVFAVAYWTNIFGDPFLEERDLFGGGWSTAYASTRVSSDAATKREIIGGTLLVYAPEGGEAFSMGFGEDGRLFSADDPLVALPQGYTTVILDTAPFTFDRSRTPRIDLIEPASSALVDFSRLSYPQAFDALVDYLGKHYAFTDYKGIDWEELRTEFAPSFQTAEENDDSLAYRRALRDFSFQLADGHVRGPFVVEDFLYATSGGLGMAIRDLDDGRVIVNFVLKDGPAATAGVELGAEVIAVDGIPIDEHVDNALAYSGPFSTDHYARLQKLRYAVQFPLGAQVDVTFRNPNAATAQTATLTTTAENASFEFSSFNVGKDGFELPLTFGRLENGYGYVKIFSFADNELLTVQLWERLLRILQKESIPGVIIDMRQNGGGSGFLADQMAAYFFQAPLELGNSGRYDESLDAFFFDDRTVERFYLPSADLRYDGAVAVLIGPNCSSACEFFTYDMTLDDRAVVVGQYPTAGLGGSIDTVLMPENEFFQYTAGRSVDMNGEIHIEGKGVPPSLVVPITEQTIFAEGDPILDAAVAYLDNLTALDVIGAGRLSIGDVVTGRLMPGMRVRYTLRVKTGDVVDLFLEDATAQLDTVLRIYDTADNLIASNDDAADRNTPNSAIRHFEIPIDLTLVVEAATYEDAEAGAYTLSVLPGQTPSTAFAISATDEAGSEPEPDATDAAIQSDPVATPAAPEEATADLATTSVDPAAASPEGAAPEVASSAANEGLDGATGHSATVRTYGSRLSVRGGPGTEFPRIAYIPDGSEHIILESSDDGRWVRIALPADADLPDERTDEPAEIERTGWIAQEFLVINE